jgi:signal transduction histidine kinase
VLRGMIVSHFLVFALTFVAPYYVMAPAIAVMIGVVSTILIGVGTVSLRFGYRPARFFIAGWSVFLTATILRSFSTVGIIPYSWWADHIPLAGAALETLLLSLALADRINLLKRQQAEVLERAVAERTTELKDTNAELEEANRFKTQMLSIAAHDLKNPLGQIIGYAHLAEMELGNNDAVASMLHNLHRSADGMLSLVNNILDSASMELGKIHIVTEPFSLTFLLTGVYESYVYPASQKEQTILPDIKEELYMDGDAARLRQVFDNLLSNAVKYSPMGKRIWVRAFSSGDHVRVEIQDEGPGLTEDDRTKLFGFFQRLSAQPTGGESSNGVGLAIVKKIVDLHGGHIWVESGKGATFIIELPMGEKINII